MSAIVELWKCFQPHRLELTLVCTRLVSLCVRVRRHRGIGLCYQYAILSIPVLLGKISAQHLIAYQCHTQSLIQMGCFHFQDCIKCIVTVPALKVVFSGSKGGGSLRVVFSGSESELVLPSAST